MQLVAVVSQPSCIQQILVCLMHSKLRKNNYFHFCHFWMHRAGYLESSHISNTRIRPNCRSLQIYWLVGDQTRLVRFDRWTNANRPVRTIKLTEIKLSCIALDTSDVFDLNTMHAIRYKWHLIICGVIGIAYFVQCGEPPIEAGNLPTSTEGVRELCPCLPSNICPRMYGANEKVSTERWHQI